MSTNEIIIWMSVCSYPRRCKEQFYTCPLAVGQKIRVESHSIGDRAQMLWNFEGALFLCPFCGFSRAHIHFRCACAHILEVIWKSASHALFVLRDAAHWKVAIWAIWRHCGGIRRVRSFCAHFVDFHGCTSIFGVQMQIFWRDYEKVLAMPSLYYAIQHTER